MRGFVTSPRFPWLELSADKAGRLLRVRQPAPDRIFERGGFAEQLVNRSTILGGTLAWGYRLAVEAMPVTR